MAADRDCSDNCKSLAFLRQSSFAPAQAVQLQYVGSQDLGTRAVGKKVHRKKAQRMTVRKHLNAHSQLVRHRDSGQSPSNPELAIFEAVTIPTLD